MTLPQNEKEKFLKKLVLKWETSDGTAYLNHSEHFLYKINMILTNCKLYLKSLLNPKFSMLYLYTNVVTHLYTIF